MSDRRPDQKPPMRTDARQGGGSLHRLDRPLRGLEKVCKLYGRMMCGDVMMAWDYANNVAVPEKELRADKKRWAASEKAKWSIAGGQPRQRKEKS